MRNFLVKLTAFFLCLCLLTPVITACSSHVCQSVCQNCGLCKNESCKEASCKQKCKCSSIKDKDASVKYLEVTSEPKTVYVPGQIFDPTGLAVSVWLSNGKVKKYFDADFENYTSKGEALNESVTKITFTLPGRDYTFDLPIIVKASETVDFIVDGSSISSAYPLGSVVNLSLKGYLVDGSNVTVVGDKEYSLTVDGEKVENPSEFVFDKAGERKIVYSYSPFKREYKVTVYDSANSAPYAVFESEKYTYANQEIIEKDESGKIISRKRGKESFSPFGYTNSKITIQLDVPNNDGSLPTRQVTAPCSGGKYTLYFENNQGGMRAYFYIKATAAVEGDYDLFVRANVQYDYIKVSDLYEYCANGTIGADGLYSYTRSSSKDLVYNGSQLKRYSSKYDSTKKYFSWNNLMCYTTAKVATVHLKKGENIVKFRYIRGSGGHVDCFYLRPSTGSETYKTAVFAARDGKLTDLSGNNFVVVRRGEKVSTYTNTPPENLVQYTNIFYRFENGFELNITENMISGVDYNKTGLQKATVSTGDFYGLSATFDFNVLVID